MVEFPKIFYSGADVKAHSRSGIGLVLAVAVLGVVIAFLGSFATQAAAVEPVKQRTLIVYYSWSGNTKAAATQIHEKIGGDIVELKLVYPYPTTFEACVAEFKEERKSGVRREVKTQLPDMNQYDVVFLGYPNWAATLPGHVAMVLERYDFSGKTIVPFCSHGGTSAGHSVEDIAKLAPKAALATPLVILRDGGETLSRDIDAWLLQNGFASRQR